MFKQFSKQLVENRSQYLVPYLKYGWLKCTNLEWLKLSLKCTFLYKSYFLLWINGFWKREDIFNLISMMTSFTVLLLDSFTKKHKNSKIDIFTIQNATIMWFWPKFAQQFIQQSTSVAAKIPLINVCCSRLKLAIVYPVNVWPYYNISIVIPCMHISNFNGCQFSGTFSKTTSFYITRCY